MEDKRRVVSLQKVLWFFVVFFALRPSQQLRSCRFSVHITKLEQKLRAHTFAFH